MSLFSFFSENPCNIYSYFLLVGFIVSIILSLCNFMAKVILFCIPADSRRFFVSRDDIKDVEDLVERCSAYMEELEVLKQILDMIAENRIPRPESVDDNHQGRIKDTFSIVIYD